METPSNQTVQAYWEAFVRLGTIDPAAAEAGYQAWPFGSNPDMADRLGALVLQGIKTATASLVWSYEVDDQPYPVVGGYSIILDGRSLPLCIIQTIKLYVAPFDEVDEEQAYLEGEGDRTLQYWRDVHWQFFEEECRQLGRNPDPKMPVICERFTLVHR